MKFKKLIAIVFAVTALTTGAYSANANDRDIAVIYGDEVGSSKVTFGRSARALSEVAENVTVVTAEDIKRLQARTLDDVMRYYPGVLPYPNRVPGDLSVPMIQGLPNRQCLVTYDGMPLNNLGDSAVDIGLIPVTSLDRIEIVKGPASSVWGRSVGAVINLVTRDPNTEKKIGGEVSWSYGEEKTTSGHINLNGVIPETGTGYFVSGGYGGSDGFQPHVNNERKSYYGKLTQKLGSKNDFTILYARTAVDRDFLKLTSMNVQGDNHADAQFVIAKLLTRVNGGSELESSLYYNYLDVTTNMQNINPILPFLPIGGIQVQRQAIRERTGGAQFAYKLNTSSYWLTLGLDGATSELKNSDFSLAPPPHNTSKKIRPTLAGAYLSLGWNITDSLAATGSVRYDYSNKSEDTTSPSFGLIYKLGKTIFRASFGYGYSLPTLANSQTADPEHLWRGQVGAETNNIPGIWAKANFFYDRTEDIKLNLKFLDLGPSTVKNLVRQGVETEIKTVPVFNTTFSAGYTFTDIYDRDTRKIIEGLPRHHAVFNANYCNDTTDLLFSGRYVFWNSATTRDAVIWDLLLTQKILAWKGATASAQFAVHNIFNGAQYSSPVMPNQPRWYEGGIRMEF